LPIVRQVPDAKYLILNIANGANLPAEDSAIIQKADVLMDTSGRALGDLSNLIQKYGREKFGFGTHAPILDYLTGLLRIEAMRENEAGQEIKEYLKSGNAKRFLNLN
jgi:uncharacterized protein